MFWLTALRAQPPSTTNRLLLFRHGCVTAAKMPSSSSSSSSLASKSFNMVAEDTNRRKGLMSHPAEVEQAILDIVMWQYKKADRKIKVGHRGCLCVCAQECSDESGFGTTSLPTRRGALLLLAVGLLDCDDEDCGRTHVLPRGRTAVFSTTQRPTQLYGLRAFFFPHARAYRRKFARPVTKRLNR